MVEWIFAYGSLMWNPEFPVAETVLARVGGFRRGFFLRSIEHRGTPDRPGLVLALDRAPDLSCQGLALRLPEHGRDKIIARIRARELVTSAYHEHQIDAELSDGRRVQALAYVIDRTHAQYAGALSADQEASIIAHASGGRGSNAEYLYNTVAHLDSLGIGDPALSDLCLRVQRLRGETP